MPPLVNGDGVWLVVTSKELNSHVTLFFKAAVGKGIHKTHELVTHLGAYVSKIQSINKDYIICYMAFCVLCDIFKMHIFVV